ncbi:MAG: DoxX family protein [Bauldia sp.]
MDALKALALLVGRIFIAGIFLWDATVMVRFWDSTVSYMEAFGLPGGLLPLAALFQFVGGALVVLGLITRPTALAFAGYCLMTALIFHNNLGDSGEVIHFGKDFAMAGGFLFLVVAGPGDWSLDARIGGG